MSRSLDRQVALVTGAASGIGRAASLAFARQGARVVVSDVDVPGGEETVARIRGGGGEAVFVRADVSVVSEVESLVRRTVDTYGRLDCAHNNAAIEGQPALLHEYREDVWDRVMSVNLKGLWLCMKFEIVRMLELGGGAIVNTASTAGLVGSRGRLGAYSVSKHGVICLTRTAAREYASQGIRVNAVCPGAIETPMAERLLGDDLEARASLAAAHPLGRFGTPEEVAEAAVWLCSNAASFVTGHALPIDGGYLA